MVQNVDALILCGSKAAAAVWQQNTSCTHYGGIRAGCTARWTNNIDYIVSMLQTLNGSGQSFLVMLGMSNTGECAPNAAVDVQIFPLSRLWHLIF
jgi:hypothetical protein